MVYSKAKLLEMAAEESKTAREYAKQGLLKFASDEARHARFFKMLASKR